MDALCAGLKRIEDGSYGYCLETGEEIGIKRLEARPVATLSIEAQERRERREEHRLCRQPARGLCSHQPFSRSRALHKAA